MDDQLNDAKTLSESTFRRIRADILTGVIAPGSPLKSDALRERYDVGISPLREALSRLAALGLVIISGQRGYSAASISVEDLIELTKARVWIEDIMLRSSIAHGDRAWEARILSATHLMRGGPHIRTINGRVQLDHIWETHHRSYHAALLSACNSPKLHDICGRLYDESDRYRWISAQDAINVRDVDNEHTLIAEAVIGRKADASASLMQAHYLRTAARVLTVAFSQDNITVNATIQQIETELLLGHPRPSTK